MLDIIRILQIIKKYKVKIILCDSPSFSNTWQYLRCYPVFEAFCGFKLAAEDERVETGFVNDGHLLGSGRGLHFGDTSVFFEYPFSYSICWFTVSQRRCYIFPHKPWFSVFLNTSQISKFWIVEELTLRNGR